MNILGLIGGIFPPLTKLISEFVEDPDAANEIKYKMFELQMNAANKAMEYDKALLDSRAKIIEAEANGASFLQRTWRPITMLTFLTLVVCDSFGVLATPLAPEAWVLLKIGLGGFVVGRSVEKVVPKILEATKK